MGQIIIIIHIYLCFPTRPPTPVCNPKPGHLYILYVDWGILQHCLQWANKYICLMPAAFGPHTIIIIIVCPTKFPFNIPNCFRLNVSSYFTAACSVLSFGVLRRSSLLLLMATLTNDASTKYYLLRRRFNIHSVNVPSYQNIRLEHGFGPSRQLIMNNRFTF